VTLFGDEVAFEALGVAVVDVHAAGQPVPRVRAAAVRVIQGPDQKSGGDENGDDHDAPPGVRCAVAL
jgi:hypothetical protein